jgi:hypothetical protein
MGVTSVLPIWEGQTGELSFDATQYTAVWHVAVDDPFDGPNVVLIGGIGLGLPIPGAFYWVGNDLNLLLTLRKLVPTRVAGTRLLWMVVGTYESPGRPQDHHDGTDDNGKPTKDPLKFHDEIEISYAQHTRPMEKAKLISPAIPGVAQGVWGPVRNSAGAVFAPPLERDNSRFTLKITKNKASYPSNQADNYRDAVNSDTFTISKSKLGFTRTFQKYTVKMKNIGGRLQFQNDVVFWPVVYEMEIDTEFGWRFDVLDKGLAASARAGDPDGRGGTISNSDIQRGQPQMRRLVDAAGVPLSEPVLLDGKGQPLAPGADPVYLTYQGYDELSFGALTL